MRIRSLFSVLGFVGLFLTLFSVNSFSDINERCPKGYKASSIFNSYCSLSGTNSSSCQGQYNRCLVNNYGPDNICAIEGHPEYDNKGQVRKVKWENCALDDNDIEDDTTPCYPLEDVCKPNKECTTPEGRTFEINQGQQCDDYCEFKGSGESQFRSCDWGGGPSNDPPLVSTGPSGNSGLGGGESGWDCDLEPFLCDYDTNGDGQISDSDNQDEWPSPSDGVDPNEGCIASGASGCDIFDNDGDPDSGDPDNGDPDNGDPDNGDPDNSGDPDNGDPDNGDPDNGDPDNSGDPDNGEEPPCTDRYSCEQLVKSLHPNCLADRDFLTFFYESPNSFSGECSSCAGPSALNYEECESSYCPYGYDSESGKCWSVDCPHGDCPDPEDETSKEDPPEPPEEPENNDKVEGLLGDILRELQTPDLTREDIQVQTELLEGAIENLGNQNKAGSDEMVSAIEAVKTAVEGIETGGGGTSIEIPEFDDSGIVDAINQAKQTSVANRCAQTGMVYVAPSTPEGTGTCEAPTTPFEYSDLDQEGLEGFGTAIEESEIGKSVASITSYKMSVSSTCGGAFIYSLPTGDLPFISRDMSVDLCQYLTPVTPFLRVIALMFWTILGLRVILDA